MGTLFNQQPRNSRSVDYADLKSETEQLVKLSKEFKITLDQAIDIRRILEDQRTNYLRLDSGDIWDEQIGGLGEILQDLARNLTQMKLQVKGVKLKNVNGNNGTHSPS